MTLLEVSALRHTSPPRICRVAFDSRIKTLPTLTRRKFVGQALGLGAISNCIAVSASASSLHCTPAPKFPVPLTAGMWRSAPFPVGKHDYHVELQVDRMLPLAQLDCELGPSTAYGHCNTPPLLDVAWKIWDGDVPVKCWSEKPIRASAWAEAETSCFLGTFEGKRNGMFTLEWNVKQDAGRLKELHPQIYIVKNPGYWCWL